MQKQNTAKMAAKILYGVILTLVPDKSETQVENGMSLVDKIKDIGGEAADTANNYISGPKTKAINQFEYMRMNSPANQVNNLLKGTTKQFEKLIGRPPPTPQQKFTSILRNEESYFKSPDKFTAKGKDSFAKGSLALRNAWVDVMSKAQNKLGNVKGGLDRIKKSLPTQPKKP
uniref:AlNc14C88G5580 protein n=1 Tax=Albugo laibachii Nc14 TaxID=890382 RepID=F0WG50_9STRA|nr:AlNc14C88G5580 [Albugo laibachii Nc14]|eukprot:CCA20185.1 AlNc14C88G5580 [Albugo laibachii Nc14]